MITAAGRARPATVVPAWFLLPGLGALLASVVAYVQYQRYVPAVGLDLDIYREAVQAFRAGRPVYDLTFALGLPYTYPPVTLSLLTPLATLEAAEALHVMTALSIAAVSLTVWFATGRWATAGPPAGSVWPAQYTGLALARAGQLELPSLGQVNAFLICRPSPMATPTGSGSRRRPRCGDGLQARPGNLRRVPGATRRFRAAADGRSGVRGDDARPGG